MLKQTHSNKCHFILKRPSKKLVGDGLITSKKNLALGILTADCAPVLIYDKKLPMIAAIHVGWKGAFKNILKKCIKFMIKKGSENKNISVMELCLSYIFMHKEIDKVIIGIDSLLQLNQILNSLSANLDEEINFLSSNDENLIDPNTACTLASIRTNFSWFFWPSFLR